MEEYAKEIAKMLIDIMKYLITIVLISTMLGDFEDKTLVYIVGIALAILFGFLSFVMYNILYSNTQNKNNKRRK